MPFRCLAYPANDHGCPPFGHHFFHRVSSSLELDTRLPLIHIALKRVAQGHAQVGTQQQVRLPVALSVPRGGVTLIPQCGVGGRALFLALDTSFFFLPRASEMFGGSRNAMHVEHGLRRGDDAFFKHAVQLPVGQWHLADHAMHVEHGLRRGDDAFFKHAVQLPVGQWHLADHVELRFRSYNHRRVINSGEGKVLTRVRTHAPQVFEAGGGAVDLMIGLLSCNCSSPSHAPLVAFGVKELRRTMLAKHQADSVLR